MELTAQLVLWIVAGAIAFIASTFSIKYGLEHIEWFKKHASVPSVLGILGAFLIAAIVASPGVPGLHDWIWGPTAAPSAGPQPSGGIYYGPIGLAFTNVSDAYKVPTTAIGSAAIYISRDQPVAGSVWTEIATDTTDASGGAVTDVTGVTSGQIYITAYKTGFYSEYATQTIPGAEILPLAPAIIKLENIGTWLITISDNSNFRLTTSGGTIYIENSGTAATGYFTLNITTSVPTTAIKNILLAMTRSDNFTGMGATIVPIVLNNGGCAVSATGDPSLATQTTGGYTFNGNLAYGYTIQIKFLVSWTATGVWANTNLARVSLNDLLGTTGYLAETGVAENVLYIRTDAT